MFGRMSYNPSRNRLHVLPLQIDTLYNFKHWFYQQHTCLKKCFWTATFFTFLFSHLRVILMTAQVTVNLFKQECRVQFEKMCLRLASCELQIGRKLWWKEAVFPVRGVRTSSSLCSRVGCTEHSLNVSTEAEHHTLNTSSCIAKTKNRVTATDMGAPSSSSCKMETMHR